MLLTLHIGFIKTLYLPVPNADVVSDIADKCLMIHQKSTTSVSKNNSNYCFQYQEKHSKNRPFVCSQCHKSFTQKHVLDDHFRIHTGEKPFVCNFCKRGFRQKNNLKRHMRSHHI